MGDVKNFFNDQNKEEIQGMVKNAPKEDQGGFIKNKQVKFGGRFKMVADTVAFIGEDGAPVVLPRLQETKNGDLMAVVRLAMVNSVKDLNPGDYVTLYQVFMAKSGSDTEKIAKFINMSTPKIRFLTGVDEPNISDYNWVHNYMTIDYNEKKGSRQCEVTRDHKMKEVVMVTIKMEHDGTSIRPNITKIEPATSTDTDSVDEQSYKEYLERKAKQEQQEQTFQASAKDSAEKVASNPPEDDVSQALSNDHALDDDLPF